MDGLSKPGRAARDTDDAVRAFSQGVISRQRAMDLLDTDYGELLDQIASRGLPLPQLPKAEVERMVDIMLGLLD